MSGASPVKVSKIIEIKDKPLEGAEKEKNEVGLPGVVKEVRPPLGLAANADEYKVDPLIEDFGPDTPSPPAIRYFGDFEAVASPSRAKASLLFGDVMKSAVEVALRAFGYFVPPAPLPGPIEGLTTEAGTNVLRMPSKSSTAFLGREAIQASGIAPIVVPNDPSISKMHARIQRKADGTYTIEDLSSKTGTYVNGQKLRISTLAYPLNPGDVIRIGGTDIKFQG